MPVWPPESYRQNNDSARPDHATRRSLQRSARLLGLTLLYGLLIAACLGTLAKENELSLGRNPVANLIKTAGEFARPSFVDAWLGNPNLEYRSDDGTLLRVENRQEVEQDYLAGLGRATWTTIRIATLGSLLGALLALPLAVLTARNLVAPKLLAWLAKGILDVSRSIHTLVFGLVLVGIVGLGPTAGILAIGLHSMGTYGKLFAESIESLDMAAIDAVKSVGAGPVQVFSMRYGHPYYRNLFQVISTSGNSIFATRPYWVSSAPADLAC